MAAVRQADRLNAIMESLSRDGHVAVSALSRGLGVSEASVRRDLSLLEAQRWLERTHGGAVARTTAAVFPLGAQADARQADRFRIAEAAMTRVPERAKVGLAAGPVMSAVGRALLDRGEMTVVTNALDIAYELSIQPAIKVVVAGGVADRRSLALGGVLAERALRDLHLDIAFVSGDGVSARAGLTVEDENVSPVTRQFIESAERAVAVVDSDAIGATAFARVCGIDRLHEVITDARLEPEARDLLEDAGLPVSVV